MTATNTVAINLDYGDDKQFSCEMDADRVAVAFAGPPALSDFQGRLRESLASPIEYPPFKHAVVPDDQVTIALDRETPHSPTIIAEIWRILNEQGVAPSNIVIIQPHGSDKSPASDPRAGLPEDIRNDVRWVIHDPEEKDARGYLASTSNDERIYLAKDVLEAGIVVTVGAVAYDPLLGFRGTNSVLYPGMSSDETVHKFRGQAQRELEPGDERPLRQTVDEIAWLLGNQFTIQVIESRSGGIADVFAGASDAVFKRAQEVWSQNWIVEVDQRVNNVVVAVDRSAERCDWQTIAAAVDSASRLVSNDGRVVVLSDLSAPLTEAFQIIQGCQEPLDAIKPLRLETPVDVTAATQWANAVNWARTFLLSNVEPDVVEDLFAQPLSSVEEVSRLMEAEGRWAFVASGQNTYGRVKDT